MKQLQSLKSDLTKTRIVESQDFSLDDGEIAVVIENFAFTANLRLIFCGFPAIRKTNGILFFPFYLLRSIVFLNYFPFSQFHFYW